MRKEGIKEMRQDQLEQLENILKNLIQGIRKVEEGYTGIVSSLDSLSIFLENEPEGKKIIKERIEECREIYKEQKNSFLCLSASLLGVCSFL